MVSPSSSQSPAYAPQGRSRAHPLHDAARNTGATGDGEDRRREATEVPLGRVRRAATVAAMVAAAMAVDLGTKALAVELLAGGVPQSLMPVLDLSLVFNRGISFSLFQAPDPTSLALLLAMQVALTCFVIWLALNAAEALQRLGFSAIAGGAISNVLDRFMDGAVTDFLDLHTAGIRWFTFNLADVWISVGVVLLILDALPIWPHRAGMPGGLAQ
jgi:signal peptidase II